MIRVIPLRIRDFLRLLAHIQMLPILESGEETLVGGQAVMEGVMMRAPHSYCVSVRRADGTIVSEERPIHRMSEKYPFFKYPLLRGLGTLGQAMQLGTKALHFSANAALEEAPAGDPVTTAGQKIAVGSIAPVVPVISSWMMAANLIFSLGVFIFLYKFIPLAARHPPGTCRTGPFQPLRGQYDRRRNSHGHLSNFPVRAFSNERYRPGV